MSNWKKKPKDYLRVGFYFGPVMYSHEVWRASHFQYFLTSQLVLFLKRVLAVIRHSAVNINTETRGNFHEAQRVGVLIAGKEENKTKDLDWLTLVWKLRPRCALKPIFVRETKRQEGRRGKSAVS